MDNPVGWFEIYVEDMARAKAFYEKVFGVELSRLDVPEPEMWTFPMKSEGTGATGALVRMPGVRAGSGNSVLIYFICEDCAVQAARAADAGGRVDRGKTSIGKYGHIALVIDTEGNMIGLHSMN